MIRNIRIHPLHMIAILLLSIYVFGFQLNYPFPVKYILYAYTLLFMVIIVVERKISIPGIGLLFFLIVAISFVGSTYSSDPGEGFRYALIQLSALLILVAISNIQGLQPSIIRMFLLLSCFSILGVIIQYFFQTPFLVAMSQVLRQDCYESFSRSYITDRAFAGWTAYTGYTAFYGSVIIGVLIARVLNPNKDSKLRRLLYFFLIGVLVFAVFLTSKRGIIFALALAVFVLIVAWMKFNNRMSIKIIVLLSLAVLFIAILSNHNEYINHVIGRFTNNTQFYSERDVMSTNLIKLITSGNFITGNGTSSVYNLYSGGAHNIYLQILYENGIIGLFIYMAFFIQGLKMAFRSKSLISIFVQTMFLTYGLVGNPLYGSNLLIFYIAFLDVNQEIDNTVLGVKNIIRP